MNSIVHFGNEKLKKAFEELKNSKVEDKMFYEWMIWRKMPFVVRRFQSG